MRKTIENLDVAATRSATKQGGISLSAEEMRALYLLKENHVADVVNVAALLDEGQRRLAVRMLQAMVDHKRSMLS